MKKLNLCIAILINTLLFFSCQKQELTKYNSRDNIYLNYKLQNGNQDTSTLTYSFAENPSLSQDTLWIPVIISGRTTPNERLFKLSVVDSLSTARAGLHFEPLAEMHNMPADSGTIQIPLVIKNTDPELANISVKLTLRISGGESFNSDLPLSMRTKSIQYSARLEQPDWWIFWMGNLGLYSRTKHQLFLIGSGSKSLVNMSKPDAYLQIPRTLYYLDNFKKFCSDPGTWIDRNPGQGYVLSKRTDGSPDYDFFHTATPERKFHLKYFPQVDRYFFIDEKGQQIIIN